MAAPARFRARHGVIVALDADGVDACKRTIDLTAAVDGVVGYKLGMTMVLRLGLAESVRQLRAHTDLPLLYDHQKAGPDVFDMAPKFAGLCAEAGVDGLILFPTAGPRAVDAFVGETIRRGMLALVGGDLPFPDYNVGGGGYVADDALERIIDRAIACGADHFVVPGNTPDKLRRHAARLKGRLARPVFVVPGIGPLGGKIGDLVAAAGGASVYGVVGRAVYGASDQTAAARALADEALAAG
ncbi:MAG: orotidine 5'-phosphate decarboxylase [Burkholderiales bacterium]|nr:orotidine 5'-phosphate decarboxylase [Burkholderiales bacterium]